VRTKYLAMMTALAAVALPPSASAFDPDKSASVTARPRPAFDARGVQLGSFKLFPSIGLGVGYHDNVFNTNNTTVGAQEDFLFEVTPKLELNSDWGRHALNLAAQSKSYFYQDFSDEDRTDWKVSGDARVDIIGGTNFVVDAMYEEVTEPRGSDPIAAGDFFDQTEYSHWGVGGTLNHTGGRFRATLGARYDERDFDDVAKFQSNADPTTSQCPDGTTAPAARPIGTVVCNNDDRDVAIVSAVAKVGYSFSPSYAVFLRGKYNDRDFNSVNPWIFPGNGGAALEVDDLNINRDSQGWGVDLGIDFELTRLLVGEVFIGYAEQDYDNHPRQPARTLADTDAVTFGVDLEWYASMLTTVSFEAKRTIEDTTDVLTNASGFISDRYGVRVDHELMRNVLVFGKVGFGQDDYQQSIRQDDFLTAGAGATFMINNNLDLTASYEYLSRDSNINAFEYDNNIFRLTLTGKL
jgi:hypothetical protein